ncbi:MAG TPA: hypothetical protein DDW52_15730 [Planctomycetaceae bacterium]|nr:hypothetical protein [Planctomycetaceae bacterium]
MLPRSNLNARNWLLVAFAAIVNFTISPAHTGEPVIESVSSPVCQRGGQVQLRLEGEGFEGCQNIVFYSDKIRCVDFKVDSDYEMSAKIEADSDCAISNQPFRVLSKFGFSELRTLRITPFPVLSEESSGATKIKNTDGLTFRGVLESGDIDRYEVELKKGERLSVEVEAIRLGYELLDTVLKITDPRGSLVVRVDDDPLFQQDPVASLVAETTGQYIIEIHETNYQGGATSHYALHVGSFPRPSVVYPAGGPFGQDLEFELIGADGVRSTHSMSLPSSMHTGSSSPAKLQSEPFDFRPTSSSGTSVPTPLPFRLNDLAATRESEPNDSAEEAHNSSGFPAAFDGIIDFPGDVDWFRLSVPQSETGNQRLRIEVFADRVGSPIDTMVQLFDTDGQFVASNDDWGSHDSRVELMPTEQTEYFVVVSDKLGGGKPNSVYRVEARWVAPEVTAFLPRPDRVTQSSQVISVPQGNRVLKRVAVKREYFDGEVLLQFQGLPAGVHASPIIVPEDQFWVPAILQCDPTTELGGELVQLNASSALGDAIVKGGFEQTVDLVHSTADQLFNSVTVDRLPVAVTPSVPFRVDVVAPKAGLPVGGTMQLNIRVERKPGFNEPIRVTLPFLPPWVVSEASVVIPAGQNDGTFNLQARSQAVSRTWNLVAEGEVDLLSAEGDVAGLESRKVASDLTELKIVATPVRGKFSTLAGLPGSVIEATCSLDPTDKFSGTFTATLEGLPARITAEPVRVDASDRSIQFAIHCAKDAPLGTFERLQCRLSGQSNGQKVSYVVAEKTQLLVKEPGKLMRDEDGKLLSPLEALRKANSAPSSSPPAGSSSSENKSNTNK